MVEQLQGFVVRHEPAIHQCPECLGDRLGPVECRAWGVADGVALSRVERCRLRKPHSGPAAARRPLEVS
jgi:hypothetical protein